MYWLSVLPSASHECSVTAACMIDDLGALGLVGKEPMTSMSVCVNGQTWCYLLRQQVLGPPHGVPCLMLCRP